MDFQPELDFACQVARAAGEVALQIQRRGLHPQAKADDSPVTEADQAAEAAIVAHLAASYPDDGLLGEEGARRHAANGRTWIIDPIDGTRDFIRGNPLWGVFLALEAAGEVVVGVAHFPLLHATYAARRGGGAFLNGSPIRVSLLADPARCVVCFNSLNRILEFPFAPQLLPWLSRFWAVRCLGGGPDAMMVASGKADLWIEPSAKAWDLAPLKIITEEAGGLFFNFDGGASIYAGNCVTCTPALAAEVHRLLAPLPPSPGAPR